MTRLKKLATTSVLGLAMSLAAAGVGAAQQSNALACARTESGDPILIGTPVYDSDGMRVGSVSLSQCTREAEPGKLRVFMSPSLGSDVRVFNIEGVEATTGAVTLPLTGPEVAERVLPDDPVSRREASPS